MTFAKTLYWVRSRETGLSTKNICLTSIVDGCNDDNNPRVIAIKKDGNTIDSVTGPVRV